MAVDVASQAPNWSGSAVGSGQLPRGNTKEAITDPGTDTTAGLSYSGSTALAVASRDGTTFPYSTLTTPALEFAEGYRGTGNNSGQAVGSGWEQRRTNYLSTGEVIWDLAGNAWTMTRFTTACGDCSLDGGLSGNTALTFNSRFFPHQGAPGGDNWYELSLPSLYSNLGGAGNVLSSWLQPGGTYWDNSSNLPTAFGLGRYYVVNNAAGGINVLIRGGRLRATGPADQNGLFAAGAAEGPTFSHYSYGFVCVMNP